METKCIMSPLEASLLEPASARLIIYNIKTPTKISVISELFIQRESVNASVECLFFNLSQNS